MSIALLAGLGGNHRPVPELIAQTEADVTELNRQAAEHLAKIRETDGWRPGPERIQLVDAANRIRPKTWT